MSHSPTTTPTQRHEQMSWLDTIIARPSSGASSSSSSSENSDVDSVVLDQADIEELVDMLPPMPTCAAQVATNIAQMATTEIAATNVVATNVVATNWVAMDVVAPVFATKHEQESIDI